MDQHINLLLQPNEEDLEMRAALACVLVLGIEDARTQRARRRNESRLYLCRPQLMPFPRVESAWQRLYESQDDRAFITTMGVDVETFHTILDSGFQDRWDSTPIPRPDVASRAQPCLGAHSLKSSGALGLILHYLNSGMLEVSLQQIFALIPSTVSRYLDFAKTIILETIRTMPAGAISFPCGDEFEQENQLIIARHPLLLGAFGSVDGLALPAQTAEDPEVENATYNSWKASHFISNVLAFSPQGQFSCDDDDVEDIDV